MSRAYHASIGVFRKQFYTFDFGNNFHIVVADVAALDRPAIKAALAADTDFLTVGPIRFDLKNCAVNIKGTRIGPTTWIASEYADTLIICNLPAVRDEIVYLVKSLIHLLEST
jgi:hypothetical protein